MTDEGMNYYLILELDPSIDDWGVIEKRLEEKKKEWSRNATMGKPADLRKAQHYLKYYDNMVATLREPETRREIAREAQRRLDEEKKAKYKDLDDSISILKTNGSYTENDVKDLYIRLKKAFSEKEIEERIKSAGIPLQKKTSEKRQVKPRLAQEDINAIRRELEFLKIENLYVFLGESPRTLYSVLRDKADEGNRAELRIGKADPISNSKKSLYGLCMKIFSTQDGKDRYDNTLALEKMESLKNQIDIAGGDGFITTQELDALINLAREKGVPIDEAKGYIEEYAEKKKWRVQQASAGELPSQNLLQCGNCFTVAKTPNATHCAKCGEELYTECPNCHKKTPTQDMACINCGFNSGYSPIVKGLLKQGKESIIHGDYPKAIQCFDLGLLYWSNWQPLIDAKKEVDRIQKERDKRLDNIRNLIATAELMKARTELDKFRMDYKTVNVDNLQKQIDDGIKQAELLFIQGEAFRSSGKIDDALDKYQEGLRICKDHNKIKTAVASCPPNPPDELSITPLGNGLRLIWKSKNQRPDTEYVVIRKANGFPTSESDGTKLAKIKNTTFDDNNPGIGIPWYYAVYTSRAGALSIKSAQSGPHLITGDVKNLVALAGDGIVSLSWTPVPESKTVEIWRKIGSIPTKRGDGDLITSSGNSLQDSKLKNGMVYGYLIISVFADPINQGKDIYSRGVSCVVTPVAPPKPVLDLACKNNKEVVTLTWTPIPGASVQIRKCDKLPNYSPGLVIPIQQANRFGDLVPANTNGNAQLSISKQGRIYFIPISYISDTAVVGKHVLLTTIDDITNLEYKKTGKDAIFTWQWPDGIDEAFICYSSDSFIDSPTNTFGTKVRVTKEQYDRKDSWQVTVEENKKYFFTIFTKASDIDAYSQGIKATINFGETISASYKLIQKKGLLSRSVKEAYIELESSKIKSIDNAICVVGKKRSVPTSIGDGVLIGEVNSIRFNNGKAQIPIDEKHIGKDLYLKLFFKDPEANNEIRLLPASKEELKLA